MNLDDLTEEQRAFAEHPGEAFVEACPGSGKTGTIVARLQLRADRLPVRKGIALLSFTNSAVDEFRDRLGNAGLAALDRYPSFVGTFDSFIRTFVFAPGGAPGCPIKPTVIDSWATLDRQVRLRRNSFAGPGVMLDLFDPGTNQVDPQRIGHTGLRNHVLQNQADYEQAAHRMRQGHHRAGIFSAACARLVARDRIRHAEWGRRLGAALVARFAEVVIDEAQDCNPDDLEIVTWLRGSGVPVTLVCDMDQSIYSFRHGLPAALREYQLGYRVEDHLSLTGNFRSTNAICILAATLRGRADPDRPCGETKDLPHPVMLLSFPGRVDARIGTAFVEKAQELNIGPRNCIVLAHKRKVALRSAGATGAHEGGTSNVEALARAVGIYNNHSESGRHREQALIVVERLLLELQGEISDGEHLERVVERRQLERRILRRQALSLISTMPTICADNDAARTAWVMAARGAVESLGLDVAEGVTINRFFQNRQGDWHRHLTAVVPVIHSAATVHEAKGRQYEAVCVVIPPDRGNEVAKLEPLLNHWAGRTASEPKRVVYVGVTRARCFVTLAVPGSHKDRFVAILAGCGVPFVESAI